MSLEIGDKVRFGFAPESYHKNHGWSWAQVMSCQGKWGTIQCFDISHHKFYCKQWGPVWLFTASDVDGYVKSRISVKTGNDNLTQIVGKVTIFGLKTYTYFGQKHFK